MGFYEIQGCARDVAVLCWSESRRKGKVEIEGGIVKSVVRRRGDACMWKMGGIGGGKDTIGEVEGEWEDCCYCAVL
jgi:hypothetical protein